MDEPQKHNADFRIPDVKVHIFWLYLCPFTLVVLNLFSLFFSNLSTLHLGVFIFIFILLSVPLHFIDLCDGIFLLILEMFVIISSSTFSVTSLFWVSNYTMLDCLILSHINELIDNYLVFHIKYMARGNCFWQHYGNYRRENTRERPIFTKDSSMGYQK